MTRIGFGAGESILVNIPLMEVRDLLQVALDRRQLVVLEARNGETVVINPGQVKMLQSPS